MNIRKGFSLILTTIAALAPYFRN